MKTQSGTFTRSHLQNNFGNYQNVTGGGPGQQKAPYPYMPRQEGPAGPGEQAGPGKPGATTPTRPPVAQKPRFVIKPSDLQKPGELKSFVVYCCKNNAFPVWVHLESVVVVTETDREPQVALMH